jgi:methylenetetrahydrofolate dehydrogenase (NADP+)/methenyltetrahydrofolate cyclohydrolase
VPRGGARLLEGGPIAAEIRQAVSEDVAAYRERHGRAPGLAVVICGRSAPSMVYLQQILRSCEKVGIDGRLVEIDGQASEASLVDAIRTLNADPTVNGIIVQMPLPPTIRLRSVVDAIDPAKDIDGIHPLNAGLLRLGYDGFLPATAHAAVEILRRSGIEIEGKRAVVVGRSAVVGMPAAFLLVRENATVTVCHSRTRDLARHVKDAEILVVAAGHPGLIRAGMLRRGVVVVDVGINVVDGAIVGDVDFESARRVASAITPVPGGVGPLTNALLLAHLVRAALAQEASAGESGGSPIVPPRAPGAPADRRAGTVPRQRVASAASGATRGVR